MEPKTITRLKELCIGDSFVYMKRVDPWRVMALADKSGRVAVNQINAADRKPIWKHDELKKGHTKVTFLRHTKPVPGQECLVDDLKEGDVFFLPDDIIHEWILVNHGHLFADMRRSDQSHIGGKIGRATKVTFVKHKDQ